jgi:hypothetical protein
MSITQRSGAGCSIRGKLNCRPYRDGEENNPQRLGEAASRAFSNRSNILTIRHSLKLIVEPGLYMLLRFQKAAGRGNYETRNQAFSKCLRFLTIRPPASKTRRRLVLMNHSTSR